jgi:hypothetical protein
VPKVDAPEFIAEARRQSLLAAQTPHASEDRAFVEAITEGWPYET